MDNIRLEILKKRATFLQLVLSQRKRMYIIAVSERTQHWAKLEVSVFLGEESVIAVFLRTEHLAQLQLNLVHS